jgi:hypothetical protein
MSKGFNIYLVILLAIAVFVDYLILKPVSLAPSTTQTLTLSNLRETYVKGEVDSVKVTSASNDFYRIKSGETFLEGQFVTGTYYQETATLAPGHWVVEAGHSVPVDIKASSPVSILTVSNSGNYAVVIIMTLLATMFLVVIGVGVATTFRF